jgi:hypothetical protein
VSKSSFVLKKALGCCPGLHALIVALILTDDFHGFHQFHWVNGEILP